MPWSVLAGPLGNGIHLLELFQSALDHTASSTLHSRLQELAVEMIDLAEDLAAGADEVAAMGRDPELVFQRAEAFLQSDLTQVFKACLAEPGVADRMAGVLLTGD